MNKALILFFTSVCSLAPLAASSGPKNKLLSRGKLAEYIAHDNGSDTIQLSVPDQRPMPNGGTSCGYQALFNGLAIRNLLRTEDGNLDDSILKEIKES